MERRRGSWSLFLCLLLISAERKVLIAKAHRTRGWIRVLGKLALMLLAAWMSFGLSAGDVFAAPTEAATAEKPEEAAAQESDETTESDDPSRTKEEKPGEKKEDEPSEKEETDKTEEQPGDKDAEEEKTERPLEEEPEQIEAKLEETKPPEEGKEPPKKKKCIIGATATLMEKQSEILFQARVDSGAKSCSLHVENIKIDKEGETMADNIGKVIRFQIKNGEGKKHWLESKISGYVIIKTSSTRARRYKVPLTFQWKHMEKKVLVTLNNRNSMEYPLLLGRNFLRGDFLIDVELDSDD